MSPDCCGLFLEYRLLENDNLLLDAEDSGKGEPARLS